MPLDGQVAGMRATVLNNGALQALMLGRPVTALACFQARPPERTDCIRTARSRRCGPSSAVHTRHAVLEHSAIVGYCPRLSSTAPAQMLMRHPERILTCTDLRPHRTRCHTLLLNAYAVFL